MLSNIVGDLSIDMSAEGLASVAKYCLTETQSGPNRIAEASELMRRLCYSRVALGLPEDLRYVFGLALALRCSTSGATDEEARIFATVNIDSQTMPPLAELNRGMRRSDVFTSQSPRRGGDSPVRAARFDLAGRGESPTRAGR